MWGNVGVSQHERVRLKGSLRPFAGSEMSKSALLVPMPYRHPGVQTATKNNLLQTTQIPTGVISLCLLSRLNSGI